MAWQQCWAEQALQQRPRQHLNPHGHGRGRVLVSQSLSYSSILSSSSSRMAWAAMGWGWLPGRSLPLDWLEGSPSGSPSAPSPWNSSGTPGSLSPRASSCSLQSTSAMSTAPTASAQTFPLTEVLQGMLNNNSLFSIRTPEGSKHLNTFSPHTGEKFLFCTLNRWKRMTVFSAGSHPSDQTLWHTTNLLMQIWNVSFHRYAAGKLKRDEEVTIKLLHALWQQTEGLQRIYPLGTLLPPWLTLKMTFNTTAGEQGAAWKYRLEIHS